MTRRRPPHGNDPVPADSSNEETSGERQDAVRNIIVERAETVPMTPEEYDTAVSVLAELVLQWERKGAPDVAPKKAA
ncbi:CopG family transcriptional regulator [Frankia sp. AiPs1]